MLIAITAKTLFGSLKVIKIGVAAVIVQLECVEVPAVVVFQSRTAVIKVYTVDAAMRAAHGLRLIMKIGVNVVYDLFSDFNECRSR